MRWCPSCILICIYFLCSNPFGWSSVHFRHLLCTADHPIFQWIYWFCPRTSINLVTHTHSPKSVLFICLEFRTKCVWCIYSMESIRYFVENPKKMSKCILKRSKCARFPLICNWFAVLTVWRTLIQMRIETKFHKCLLFKSDPIL